MPKRVLLVIMLAGITLAAFSPAFNHEFISYDDDEYVAKNPYVQGGLTADGLLWSLTATSASNWHPLSWASHMLDVELFGMDSGRHHLVSVIFHVVNVILLFFALQTMTGAVWRSAAVAALFAIHPLRVESVVWVSERKDVLSGLFFMLVLIAYERYVRHLGIGNYLLVAFLLVLGLMAKPMLVTVPCVLLLLDMWPLGRTGKSLGKGRVKGKVVSWTRLVVEKVPLLLLALLSSFITYLVQQKGGAVVSIDYIVPFERLSNAVVSYSGYLLKTLWPSSLAVHYPYPSEMYPWWKIFGALLVLGAVTAGVVGMRRRHPCFLVGWLWFAGMLVPVIGLIQVGAQVMADRYTYLPHVGLFIMLVWGVQGVLSEGRYRRAAIGLVAGAAIMVLFARTVVQVRYWKDSETLFGHTLAVTSDNWKIEFNMANLLWRLGRREEAVGHFKQAIGIRPGHYKAHNNLGNALFAMKRYNEALEHYSMAVQLKPDNAEYHYNLGLLLTLLGRRGEAEGHLRESERLRKSP
ncbi:tetratricopeptide repeat protein [bacterium]|nr:tetratricopeptide repeat protein [bacterium]